MESRLVYWLTTHPSCLHVNFVPEKYEYFSALNLCLHLFLEHWYQRWPFLPRLYGPVRLPLLASWALLMLADVAGLLQFHQRRGIVGADAADEAFPFAIFQGNTPSELASRGKGIRCIPFPRRL